jgi:hypothetical protein
MATFLGILIGILATIIISRYYYKRTTRKKLTSYLTLSVRIFAGIEKNVRDLLRFTFKNIEVTDLHQIEFLIANDGEKAISNYIEPLTLELPNNVQILDASILYRNPKDLKVDISPVEQKTGTSTIIFNFPLLNKGDYFLVKFLLSGYINTDNLKFHILCDDLPRTLKPKWLPSGVTRKNSSIIDWGATGVGLLLLFFATALLYIFYLLYSVKPEFFPYPWSTFKPTFQGVSSLILCGFGILVSCFAALVFLIGIGLEDIFSRTPRLSLPEEFNRAGLPYEIAKLKQEIDDIEREYKKTEGELLPPESGK